MDVKCDAVGMAKRRLLCQAIMSRFFTAVDFLAADSKLQCMYEVSMGQHSLDTLPRAKHCEE